MRTQKITIVLIAGLVVGAFLLNRFVIASPAANEEPKSRWEYCRVLGTWPSGQNDNRYVAQVVVPSTPEGKVDSIETNSSSVVALNKLGADGWELVAAIPNGSNTEFLLKRAKR